MKYIGDEEAEKYLSQERFRYVLKTNPAGDTSYGLSDSCELVFLFWFIDGVKKYIYIVVSENMTMKFDEGLCKIKEVLWYETMELALERVKQGHLVAENLLCFEVWDRHIKNDESFVYSRTDACNLL